MRMLLPFAAALVLLLAACGSDDSADEGAGATTASGGEPVTVEWWHIQNSDPGLTLWKTVADEFMADHPNVTIDITVQENEAFKKALQTNLQAGDVPDIFQSWGGGGLREQVDAGLVKDVTGDVESWDHELNGAAASMMEIEDKMYGVPFDLGIVGVWYNKALFEKAGIDAPPETWAEFLEDVEKLKAAGITPISLAEGDKWPGMFWYGYLRSAPCGRRGDAAGRDRRELRRPGLHPRGRGDREARRARAVPVGLPRHAVGRAGRRRGSDLERQGRDAADGPLGARHDGGELDRASARTSTGSRSRRSKAARAIRRTPSAAATASPSARMRRPRRSSSWSTSRAPRSRSGSAARRTSCRRPSARRTRSPTRTSST